MAAAPFLFGKLPGHGDFVARALGDAERAAWDGWGADLLAELRARTGDGFDAAHVGAPPWRFLMREAGGWTAGAMAPSVDKVGRRFLLALGLRGLGDTSAGGAGLAFAEAAEGLIYDALLQGMEADTLLANAAERFDLMSAATHGAADALGATPRGDGLWWTLGSETFAPSAVAARVPPRDLFARTVPSPAFTPGLEHA